LNSTLSLSIFFALAFLASSSLFVAAQDCSNSPGASKQDAAATMPSLDDLIYKALTAYGGASALRSAYDNCELFGEIKFGADLGKPFSFKHTRKNGQWRTDVASKPDAANSETAQLKITAFDGRRVWQASGGNASYLSAEQSKLLELDDARRPVLLAFQNDRGYQFEFKGESEFHKVPAWRISLIKEGETPSTLFLDKTNLTIIGITYSVTHDDRTVSAERIFSEYRPMLRTLIPSKTQEYIDGEEIYEIQLTECSNADAVGIDFFSKPGLKQNLHLAQTVSVPFDYSQKEIVCQGSIDGSENLLFLFDTGSSDTIVDRRLAAQLLLSRGNDFKISAFGGDVSTQTAKLRRLELGGLIINDVDAKILDLRSQSNQLGKEISAVIGMNVIANFLVTIDYGIPSLTFADPLTNDAKIGAPVPFTRATQPIVKANLGSKDICDFLIDTGAAFNHIPAQIAMRHGGSDSGQTAHTVEGTGLDGRPIQLGTLSIDPVIIGGLSVHKVAFTYPIVPLGQAATHNRPGTGNRPDYGEKLLSENLGILGNPFWQNFIVVLDSQQQRVLLKPNPAATRKSEIESAFNHGDTELIVKRQLRAAETFYQKALMLADQAHEPRYQALAQGRLGNLRRIMAHDLQRPEHSRAAYDYFNKADEIARNAGLKDVQGRVLADWSLLYSDNGQIDLAKQTADRALSLAPQDASVNIDYAVQLFRNGLYPEMQRYIDKALFLEPSNWQALWYQVKLSEKFNDLSREKQALAEIVRFYPSSKLAVEKLKSLSASKL
jgi:Tfp pilus assembly protein PilF/predicted aspartyl protease